MARLLFVPINRFLLLLLALWPCAVSAQTVAAGSQHTVVRTPDGSVWTWGANVYGQLGDGTTTQRTTPAQVLPLSNIVAVAAGAEHTLALESNGTVWAWGRNNNGQVGDGTITNRLVPTAVASLPPIAAIAAGSSHSVALATDGSIWTWGYNFNGQLGDGTTTRSLQPIIIVTGWVATAVAAGHSHTLAIRADGTLWGWGANHSGQLGVAAPPTQWNVPGQIAGVTGAVSAAGGSCHTAVARSDGRVLTSGCNTSGQLATGNTTNRPSMDLVPSLLNAAKVYAGASFTSALTTTGEVWSWGQNFNGQLGDGTLLQKTLPAQTLTSGTVTQLAAGHNHGVAATSTGVVLTWGLNGNGQLGDGTLTRRQSPVAISDVNYQWKVALPVLSVPGNNYSTDQTVIVTNATPDAEIHYSTDGDEPTLADPTVASGGSITIDRTTTLKVRAWKGTMPPSDIVTAVYTLTVAWPTISPNGGTYTSAQTVTLATTSPGVTLRYTTDNSTPTESSPIYTAPLTIATTTTVKTIGFRTGWTNSLLRSATFTMNFGSLAAPQISPGEGTYTSSVTVTLTAMTGATIRYTTNGFTPNGSSPIYTGPLAISTPLTLKAIAMHPDYGTSPVSSAIYSIVTAAPVFTPGAGTYAPGQVVTVSCETAGATIRFTMDGRDPTATDPIIANNGTLILGNYTLKARAFKTGITTSDVTSATYQLSGALTSAQVDGGAGRSILVRPDGLAWAWGSQPGNNQFSVLSPVPPGTLTGIRSASAGGQQMVVATSTGAVYAWGSNLNGSVGDGSTFQRLTPVAITAIASVTKVAAGGKHTLALKQDGTVWAWGGNLQGQIGDGSTTQRNSPVAVTVLSGVTAVAAGEDFSLALKSDGTVWSWGDNTYGQIGNGNTTDRSQPAMITGLSGVTAISAGFGHALALKSDGTVWAWGYNLFGQAGLGHTTTPQLTPAQVSGLPAIAAIAAGGYHSVVVAANGAVYTWGSNNDGQLGDGSVQQRNAPGTVALLDDIIAVGAGSDHSLAIASDGTVWAWGDNDNGELGDGTSQDKWLPEPISGPNYNWKAQTPTVTPVSNVYTAVQTAVVTLQDPNATMHYTVNGAEPTEADPTISSGGTIPIDQSTILKVNAWKPGAPTSETIVRTYELKAITPTIAPASGAYSAAVTATITNPNSQGHVTYTLDGTEPTTASATYSSALVLSQTQTLKAVAHRAGWTSSATSYNTYWITDGTVASPAITPTAGAYDRPQLVAITSSTVGAAIHYTIDGTEPTTASPLYRFAFVVSATTTVKAKAFKAGMLASGIAVAAFALDAAGAAGTPTIVPSGGRFTTRQTVTIQAPAGATVRYTTDGRDPGDTDPVVDASGTILVERSQVLKVRAWQSGVAPSAVRSGFFVITGQVAAGFVHTLALKADGTVWGWGYNFFGTVGDGSTTNRPAPVQVGIADVQSIAGGYAHSLALKRDGTVWAWGLNNCGQLGDNSNTNSSVPLQVSGLTNVVAIAAGGENAGITYSHSLALRADGTVWAWGCNQMGQLGDGTTTMRKVPVQVVGLHGVKAIAAAGRHSYALADAATDRGIVWAWGNNAESQIGDGSTTSRTIPVRVAGLTGVSQLTATKYGALALRDDRSVWAWGSGPLRLGAPAAPAPLPLLARIFTIGAGDIHALAFDAEAIRWPWGDGLSGQLGTGALPFIETVAVLASTRVRESQPFTLEADGGTSHSVLLRSDGSVAVMGENMYGQLGTGTTTDATTPVVLAGFSLADNAWLATDVDGDGLTVWREWLAGTDPYAADTNGNGILDGIEDALGPNGGNPDSDGDGLTNVDEFERGTDAAVADTDGDGVVDGTDVFPLDPTRSSLPPPNPADTTPPVIILTQPASARPVGGGGGV